MKRLLFLLYFVVPLATDTFAQDSTFQQMLDLSRPGSNHALLGTLSGAWTFQDVKRTFVKGSLTRKPIYNGRFYAVEITGGKLQVPIADGQMKEESYQGMQIEGYDNGRVKFVTTSINNHIGSDIDMQVGTYNAATKSFTYDWESELVKGVRTQNRRLLKIVDATHYTETYYEKRNGVDVKVRELAYIKVNEK